MSMRKMSYTEILTMLVKKTSTCWEWQGSVNTSGYGQHGHEFNGTNTRIHKSGKRECIECKSLRTKGELSWGL